MHTKGTDARGGSWSRRTGVVVLGLCVGWALTATPAAAADSCGVAILGGCSEPAAPPASAPAPTPPAAPAPTIPQPSSAEAAARLLSLLNDERARAGLAPFAMRGDVTEIAAGWSAAMARSEHLSHNDAYFTKETRTRLDARMLGENVARNPSVDGAHHALMASPPHRANILEGRFVVIGIAAELRNGSWWVTQDFLQPSNGSAAPARAAAAAPAPVPATVAPSRTTAPSPTAAAPAPKPTTTAPTVAPAVEVDAGEVLAATAAAPSAVHLEPSGTSEARRVAAAADPSPSSSGVPAVPVGAAVGLLTLALLVAYRVSCASASARIRCR